MRGAVRTSLLGGETIARGTEKCRPLVEIPMSAIPPPELKSKTKPTTPWTQPSFLVNSKEIEL